MKKYQEALEMFNIEWKTFIEEQKLSILAKSNGEVVDLLLNLEFLQPRREEDEYENTDHHINLTGFEMDVKYTGELEFENNKEFWLGRYERYADGSYPASEWMINNGGWYNADELTGLSFVDFFWGLEIDDFEEVFQEILNQFDLYLKIQLLYRIFSDETKNQQHKDLIQKYNQTEIQITEEDNTLYIVFHDGNKIPYPLEK